MKEIELATSPWGFRQMPLEAQCRWLGSAGFRFICLQFGDWPGALPNTSDDRDLDRIRDLVHAHSLGVASVNVNGDFMVREGVAKEIARACHDVERAARLKARLVIVFAGWVDRSDDPVYAQVAAALKRVARHAAGFGLTVALENHGGLTRTINQVNRLLKAAGEPNLGLNYDPANFAMHGEDPLSALRNIEGDVVFTHLKSLKQVGDRRSYCRLREGEIDYPPILARLQESYHGFYALEYEEPSDVIAGTLDDRECLLKWLST